MRQVLLIVKNGKVEDTNKTLEEVKNEMPNDVQQWSR